MATGTGHMTLRIVFMGTPEFAVPTLVELIGQGHQIVACYCQQPRPAGRGMALTKSAVQRQAEQFSLDVRTPTSLKSADEQAAFAALQADVAVVVAYGLMLPPAILGAPPLGCLNLHASDLPRWRGAAPINRAIMAGDGRTAIMVMKMDEGLDTGPVALAEYVDIGPEMTAGELHDCLTVLGADLMVRALAGLHRGTLALTPQSTDGITYAHKIDKSQTRIDWRAGAQAVHNHIRGLSPFPGAWCQLAGNGEPRRLKILRAQVADGSGEPGQIIGPGLTIACGQRAIRVLALQPAGKGRMSGADFLRGSPLAAGTIVT